MIPDRYDLGRAHGIAEGRADAIRDVLALIDRGMVPGWFEGTREMRAAVAVLNGLRGDVARMGRDEGKAA